MSKLPRRELSFNSLDEVMTEVDRLLLGHQTVGNWSLGQICNHLTDAITGTMDGFPMKAPWIVRKTIGPFLCQRIIKKGKFPNGIKVPEHLAPKPGLDARAEAEALRAAIRLFASHPGPMADHPLGGPINRKDWDRFHCIHCAHHLGFAIPDTPRSG